MLSFAELKQYIKKDASSYPTLKVALLGDSATQFLAIAIKGFAVAKGYNIELFEAEYNQIERQIFDKSSDFHNFNPDYTIVFQATHKLLGTYNKLSFELQSSLAESRLNFIHAMCDLCPGRLIYFNYPEIDDTVFGNFSNKVEHSFMYQVRNLNYEIMNLSKKYANVFVCDMASLQNKMGRDFMFNATMYVNTDMVLSLDSTPHVASTVMDIICAAQGQFKKCLILDLDNTLWGGVIGDDGIENIQIGSLGIGKAFTEFQYWIKKLQQRGIVIAVCSKNTESIAKEPFEKHPDMVLKLSDIAVFVANWENKVDNIRKIQHVLNIGFDSMVFVDDNPFERNMVRENIPQITVPELPEDPALYLDYLYSLNLFETVSYSGEDTKRTEQYQKEAERVVFQESFANEDDFLKSLNMVSEINGFNNFNIPRVAQLSQRSNQFNLRTVRYTEVDIERISNDSRYKGITFNLSDKFGDNGLISVVILEKQDKQTLFIDTWFMSCRVLKRGMENLIVNTIVEYAKLNGYSQIIGEYKATAKNQMVEKLYAELGFSTTADNQYLLKVNDYQIKQCYIKTIKQL